MLYGNWDLHDLNVTRETPPALRRIRIGKLIAKHHYLARIALRLVPPFQARVCENEISVAHVVRQRNSALYVIAVNQLAKGNHRTVGKARRSLIEIETPPDNLSLQFSRRIPQLLSGW